VQFPQSRKGRRCEQTARRVELKICKDRRGNHDARRGDPAFELEIVNLKQQPFVVDETMGSQSKRWMPSRILQNFSYPLASTTAFGHIFIEMLNDRVPVDSLLQPREGLGNRVAFLPGTDQESEMAQ
jgi:hypothetical protein